MKIKTIDDLKAEMPHVFELLEDLKGRIAKEEADHFAEMEMLRERITDPDDFRQMAYEKDARFFLSLKPMRDQVAAILGHIAGILALQPIPPIMVPSGHRVLPIRPDRP